MATVQQRTAPPQQNEGGLEQMLAQIAGRLRRARWRRHAARGVLVAVIVSLVAVVLAHFDRLPDWVSLPAFVTLSLLIGVGIGTLTAYARPISLMDVARITETRLGLKERLSSALEWERAGHPTPNDPEAALLRRLQQEDAANYARALQPAQAVPGRWPWEAKAVLPALALVLLSLFLPTLPIFVPPAVATERAIVKKSGTKLEKSAKLIEKRADAAHLDSTKRAAQQMSQLARRMAQGGMDKKKAMVETAKLTQQMAAQQRQMAQANSGLGQGGKSLSQAGKQLASALQSLAAQGGSQAGAGAKPAGSQPPKGSAGAQSKTGQKGASGKPGDGKAAGKNGAKNGQNGLTPPGMSGSKPGKEGKTGATSAAGSKPNATPELQKAAEAMKQGENSGLSEQLRQLAQRAESGKLSASEQKQAAQDLQKLSDALKGTPLSETQKHAQAAADAMKRGDPKAAAEEMRKAAASAERETKQQMDKQGMQDAQSSLQANQGEMASANSPSDIPDSPSGQSGQGGQSGKEPGGGESKMPGDGSQKGQGKFNEMPKPGSGDGQGGGAPSNGNGGESGGKAVPPTPGKAHYTPDSGVGYKTPKQNQGVFKGGAHPLNPKFDPTKNPKYGKIFLGKPGAGNLGGGKSGPMVKTLPGASSAPGSLNGSSVPYYNYVAPYRQSQESPMDKEDIPPAYKNSVRRYYDALQPTAKTGKGR